MLLLMHKIDCLTKSNYKEEKCQQHIDALYECCDAFYAKKGDNASTASCPKLSLLKLVRTAVTSDPFLYSLVLMCSRIKMQQRGKGV